MERGVRQGCSGSTFSHQHYSEIVSTNDVHSYGCDRVAFVTAMAAADHVTITLMDLASKAHKMALTSV